MKLKTVFIQNFRCYKDIVAVDFDEITTFIGKNDIGKSTVMEALEIFFNNEIVKIEPNDLNNKAQGEKVCITCDFCNLPESLTIDVDAVTNLKDEYLTIEDDTLRIRKEYDCSKAKPTEEVFIVAKHPTAMGYDKLLGYKEKELQKIIKERELDAQLKGNPQMRRAIWESCEDLRIEKVDISVTKGKEDAGRIWASLEQYLPAFALFQSDRSSKDSDDEVQNPMKAAIQTAIGEAQAEINAIKEKVRARSMEIAKGTHEVMKTLDADLASSLTPSFSDATLSKWASLFSVSMNTNDDIPLNKRGSGVRRMVLVSFFKAQADRKAEKTVKKDIIYAIEEPETSMHPNYQKLIIQSFYELSQSDHCQVILTTHSPNLAKELPTDSIRFVTRDGNNKPIIKKGNDIMEDVVNTLGLFPDVHNSIKVMICVEGPTDVNAMRCFSRCLHSKYPNIIDIECDPRVAVIPMGGSTLKHWVQERYLKNSGCKEVHIYDRDVQKYQASVDQVNSRTDGSWGTLTGKYEIENYLHPNAIYDLYEVSIDTNKDKVPESFGVEFANKKRFDAPMKPDKSKIYLSRVFDQKMTIKYLEEVDPIGEVKGWFERITKMSEE